MTFGRAVSLLTALLAGVVVYILVVVSLNQVRVVNIADWDNRTRTLRLAAPMPSCACMTLSTRNRDSAGTRATHVWDRLRALRFGADPLPDPKDIALVARIDGGGGSVGSMLLGKSAGAESWTFAFDWAGAQIGSFYGVQAFGLKKDGTVDPKAGPLDMNALFWMDAVPHPSCTQAELEECPWRDLHLNKAMGEAVGQNEVAASFTGVRIEREDRVIEAQATGKFRGALGDCGCMLLQVLKAPTTLTASSSGVHLGQLSLGQVGEFFAIPFDYVSTKGDKYYELTVNDGSEKVTTSLRLIGHLDGMDCQEKAATIAMTSPSLLVPLDLGAPAGTRPLTCPYEIANPAKKITGAMNLLDATRPLTPADKGGAAPAAPQPGGPGGPPKDKRGQR